MLSNSRLSGGLRRISAVVDTTFAEVLPAGPTDGSAQTARATHLYEYWWTIGHGGHPHSGHGVLERLKARFGDDTAMWQKLKDPGAGGLPLFPDQRWLAHQRARGDAQEVRCAPWLMDATHSRRWAHSRAP
jgi:hypothetical protein